MHPVPPRVRRRALLAAGAGAALLLAAAGADRIAGVCTQHRIAGAAQRAMHTPGRPSVHVRGFPVTPQIAGGTLRHVDITAHGIPADPAGRPLPITTLTLRMDGLRSAGDAQGAHSDSAEATAFLSYADLTKALGVAIRPARQAGHVRATARLPMGVEIGATAAVRAAAGNRIVFEDVRVRGGLGSLAQTLISRALARPVPLDGVPEGLRLDSLATGADGLTARLTGKDVTFRPDRDAGAGTGDAAGTGDRAGTGTGTLPPGDTTEPGAARV